MRKEGANWGGSRGVFWGKLGVGFDQPENTEKEQTYVRASSSIFPLHHSEISLLMTSVHARTLFEDGVLVVPVPSGIAAESIYTDALAALPEYNKKHVHLVRASPAETREMLPHSSPPRPGGTYWRASSSPSSARSLLLEFPPERGATLRRGLEKYDREPFHGVLGPFGAVNTPSSFVEPVFEAARTAATEALIRHGAPPRLPSGQQVTPAGANFRSNLFWSHYLPWLLVTYNWDLLEPYKTTAGETCVRPCAAAEATLAEEHFTLAKDPAWVNSYLSGVKVG